MARPAGVVDKRTKALLAAVEAKFPKFNGICELIEKSRSAESEAVAVQALSKACDFLYPKLKATEVSYSDETLEAIRNPAFPTVLQTPPEHVNAAEVDGTDTRRH